MKPSPTQHPSKMYCQVASGQGTPPLVGPAVIDSSRRFVSQKLIPVAGTITTKPRHVLLSPKIRFPRNERPPSSGWVKRLEKGNLYHTVCTTPAAVNDGRQKSVQMSGSGDGMEVQGRFVLEYFALEIEARLIAVLEEQNLSANGLGAEDPYPPWGRVGGLFIQTVKVIAGNTRVHMMQRMSIHVQ